MGYQFRGVRIRLPELFKDKGVKPYQLAKRSEDRISLSTVYRWKRLKGRVRTFDGEALEAMMEVFKLDSLDELLESATLKKRERGA
jgi:hypothetical protein